MLNLQQQVADKLLRQHNKIPTNRLNAVCRDFLCTIQTSRIPTRGIWQKQEKFVKIILLKSDNYALTLRKRLFCAAKPTLLPCKTAAFGTQNNRFYNALMMRRLHDSYACEKYLHLYCLLFAQKITLVRSRNVGRRHFTSFWL